MTDATVRAKLTYEENNALAVLRKALKRKPELAGVIIEGMGKDAAVSILMQARKEMADMLAVTKALTSAAGTMAQLDNKEQSNAGH